MALLVAVVDPFVPPGPHVAASLLAAGHRVRALCPRLARRRPAALASVDVRPLLPVVSALAADLAGVDVVVLSAPRFGSPAGRAADAVVVALQRLFAAGRLAAVSRLVCTTSTGTERHPVPDCLVPQALVEHAVHGAALPSVVLQVAGFFGPVPSVVGRFVCGVRAFGVVPVPWLGRPYHYRPVHVEEYADAVVAAVGAGRPGVRDVVGPERVDFEHLARGVARLARRRCRFPRLPPAACASAWRLVAPSGTAGAVSRHHLAALAADRLDSRDSSVGRLRLSSWLGAESSSWT